MRCSFHDCVTGQTSNFTSVKAAELERAQGAFDAEKAHAEVLATLTAGYDPTAVTPVTVPYSSSVHYSETEASLHEHEQPLVAPMLPMYWAQHKELPEGTDTYNIDISPYTCACF